MAVAIATFSSDHLDTSWPRTRTSAELQLTCQRNIHEDCARWAALSYAAQVWPLQATLDILRILQQSVAIVNSCSPFLPADFRSPLKAPGRQSPPHNIENSDLPLDYTQTNALAQYYLEDAPLDAPFNTSQQHGQQGQGCNVTSSSPLQPHVDFSTPHGLRTHVKKKDKKAAQAAQRNKWLDDSGDEAKNHDDGGDGDEDGNNGGHSGSGAGGDGGDGAGGGGGGGGGEDDDWDDGKKKKGKKKKQATAFSWDALDDEGDVKDAADPDATNVDAAAVEVNPDDEWGFPSTGKKKGKKIKAEQAQHLPPPATLNPEYDDEATPQLNLNFGDASTGTKSSGFAFGSWGGGWGAPVDPNPVAPAAEVATTDDAWASFGKKDNKKKKKGGEFDFNFDNTAAEIPSTIEDKPADDAWDTWGTSKKGKKDKQGSAAVLPEPATVVVPDAEAVAEDTWGTWGTAKDKKKKKGVAASAEPEMFNEAPLPATVEPIAQEDPWASFSTGMSAKDKKKAKKATKTAGKDDPSPDLPVVIVPETAAPEPTISPVDYFDSWGTAAKKEKKKKNAFATSDDHAIQEPASEQATVVVPTATAADNWLDSSWGTGKKDKKTGKKGSVLHDPAPPVPDPTDPEPPPVEDAWGFATTKKGTKDKNSALIKEDTGKKVTKVDDAKLEEKYRSKDNHEDAAVIVTEEPRPKKEKEASKWGLWGSAATKVKSPKEKDKEEKERKEREAANEAQRKADEALLEAALAEDPNGFLDLLDEEPTKKSSKGLVKNDTKKKSDTKKDRATEVEIESTAKSTIEASAGWGFWGTSTAAANTATPASDALTANRTRALKPGLQKMPEVTISDIEPLTNNINAMSPPKSTAAVKVKTGASGSVADRIKALQGGDVKPDVKADIKKAKGKDSTIIAPAPEPLINLGDDSLARKTSKDKKGTTKITSSSKKDKDSFPVVKVIPHSASPVPGRFPVDDLLETTMPPAGKSSSKDKTSSKSTKDIKPSKTEKDVPLTVTGDKSLINPSESSKAAKVPISLLEPAKDEAKPVKRERPKVVRDQGSSSWGLWGSAPKSGARKDRSPKDDKARSPVKEKSARPELGRSKSAREPSERERKEKSFDSEKAEKRESGNRPSTSRGMSLSGLFGIAPPLARTKSMRQSTSAVPRSSTRRSVNVDNELQRSPADVVDTARVSPKAAKLMGIRPSVGRKESTRDKPQSRGPPDPYAIDSDTVMAEGPVAAAHGDPKRRSKDEATKSKSKRDSFAMSGGLGPGDDPNLVDMPLSSENFPGADDALSTEEPSRPTAKRSASSAKKTAGLMGFFGSFRVKEGDDYRRSKSYDEADEQARQLRREGRKVASSRKQPDANGFADSVPRNEDPMADEQAEARRAERRARHAERDAAEAADAARRRAERKEREAAVRKAEDEREARKQEERRARRAARHAAEDQERREAEARDAERQARREERDKEREGERDHHTSRSNAASAPRPHAAERRRSHMDTADRARDDDTARRLRREERRVRHGEGRSPPHDTDKQRPRASRRRSDYPADADDFFHARNGARDRGSPYIAKGGDKTTSWVASVNEEPPPPPPLTGTIVDAPLVSSDAAGADDGAGAADVDQAEDVIGMDETTARELRRNRRRQTQDAPYDEYERRTRRRRDGEVVGDRSYTGGAGDRRSRAYNSLGYADMGDRGWGVGDDGVGKRTSWFKKIAGL